MFEGHKMVSSFVEMTKSANTVEVTQLDLQSFREMEIISCANEIKMHIDSFSIGQY